MNKKQVVVLMGGMSTEHDVSLVSGSNVVANLNRTKYDVTPVIILRDGGWVFDGGAPLDIYEAIAHLKTLQVDCVFIALHGTFGEDGRIQGLLDLLGLPYTSSGCAANALAIDKIRAKAVVREAGIRVAAQEVIAAAAWRNDSDAVIARVADTLGFPCVMKSPCQGSSVGMAIVADAEAFRAAVPSILAYGDTFLVEAFVTGREVTCAVLDTDPNTTPTALPVTEICPITSTFFDYHAKYTPGASKEITPAELPADLTARIQDVAVRAHRAIGCALWSRSDMILDDQGPVWIEINTVPGLTPTSLYPQAAAAIGISYAALLELFVDSVITMHNSMHNSK